MMQCVCTLLLLTSTLASARSIPARTQTVQARLCCKVMQVLRYQMLQHTYSVCLLALLRCFKTPV